MSQEAIPKDSLAEIGTLKQAFGTKHIPDSSFKMAKLVFYLFDEDRNRYISRSEAQRGISYLGIEGLMVPPPTKVVDSLYDSCISKRKEMGIELPKDVSNQLRFPDFVHLVLNAKTAGANVIEHEKKHTSSSNIRLAK